MQEKFTEEEVKQINANYWNIPYEQRRKELSLLMELTYEIPNRRKTGDKHMEETDQRKKKIVYFLKSLTGASSREIVCKKIFLGTLGYKMTQWCTNCIRLQRKLRRQFSD